MERITNNPLFGIYLALFGILVLSPDTMFMRFSEMEALQMVGWRGSLSGSLLIVWWLTVNIGRLRARIPEIFTAAGMVIILAHCANSALFSFGIASSPVFLVLLGVSTVPVFSSILAHLMLGEAASKATWLATLGVVSGIVIAISGESRAGIGINLQSFLGALAGLGVAFTLALTFVMLRKHRNVPLVPTLGLGALSAGLIGISIVGPSVMLDGNPWAIAVTGAIILPISFLSLSFASRYTHASNVSLIMLLETILGPIWVWIGIGEQPSPMMLIGGAIVLICLFAYLLHTANGARRRKFPHN
jgi:drug/metabolite transporter (DMT)-like permease